MDQRLDLRRVAEVINGERPDLVGLQEVDRGVQRTGRIDEIAELARLTRMEYAFAPNLRYQGGWYGVAVLSRLPIISVDHRRYANRREAERRGFLRVEVSAGGRVLNFVTTHLDYQWSEGRVFETEQLLRALETVKGPLVVVGDFNDEPTGEAYKRMLTRFTDAWTGSGGRGAGFTYPADEPRKRIDYIFCAVEAGIHLRVRHARVADSLASDHRPVTAELWFE
ncbi:MAG: endonuclease/exonuclease/phosphatase family protein [Acidobacteriota bacterium]|nr:endonuclease/exonuclease/phosphatase family protein [Acidobacteriota bacterium]